MINIIINVYSGLDGKGDIPAWAIILSALLYLLYHIFDVLDGKHARNTKTSSPLGLLMDHGCDALTTFLFAMSLASVVKIEGPFWFSIFWLMISITFFFHTLEQYYTGVLYLPIINGVGEGTLFACIIMIFTSIVGQNFWLNNVELFGRLFRYSEIITTFAFITSVMYSFVSFIKCCKHENTRSICECFSDLAVFTFMIFSMLTLVFFSESTLIRDSPKLLVYMYGLCFAKLVVCDVLNDSLGPLANCTLNSG